MFLKCLKKDAKVQIETQYYHNLYLCPVKNVNGVTMSVNTETIKLIIIAGGIISFGCISGGLIMWSVLRSVIRTFQFMAGNQPERTKTQKISYPQRRE